MQTIRIRNWERFQQYKDREPKWIKLYRSLNRNYEWSQLSDKARAQLVGLWLLAAELDNEIPFDEKWIMAQISGTGQLLVEELVTNGFIELYDDVQSCTEVYIETETEKRREERDARAREGFKPPSLEEARAYFLEKSQTVEEANRFWYFYDSKGWKVGKNQMKNWRSAASGWISRNKTESQQVSAAQPGMFGFSGGDIRRFLDANHRTPKSRQEMEEFMDVPF